jgi:hypothetical protein
MGRDLSGVARGPDIPCIQGYMELIIHMAYCTGVVCVYKNERNFPTYWRFSTALYRRMSTDVSRP